MAWPPRAVQTPPSKSWPKATDKASTKASYALHASQGMGTDVWSCEVAWTPLSSSTGTMVGETKPTLVGRNGLRISSEAVKGTREGDNQGFGQS